MTCGEKMIWSTVFGAEYIARLRNFNVDMSSPYSYEEQKQEHRRDCAALAAEVATIGLAAARSIELDDASEDTRIVLGAILECE